MSIEDVSLWDHRGAGATTPSPLSWDSLFLHYTLLQCTLRQPLLVAETCRLHWVTREDQRERPENDDLPTIKPSYTDLSLRRSRASSVVPKHHGRRAGVPRSQPLPRSTALQVYSLRLQLLENRWPLALDPRELAMQ